MRKLWLALVLCGCSSSAAPVDVSFSMVSSQPNVGTGYQAERGTASIVDGELTLSSSAGGATLLLSLDPPTEPGEVALGERHLSVEYDLGIAGWASNGGAVRFETLDPWTVTFEGVQMLHATDAAQGSFTLDGTATFAQ